MNAESLSPGIAVLLVVVGAVTAAAVAVRVTAWWRAR